MTTRTRPRSSRSGGFSLLELLVVITIIGILAGIMFPVISRVISNTRKAHAENDALQLKNAITTYFTEYRKYPADPGSSESSTLRSDHDLMDILLAADNSRAEEFNPRKVVFFTGKQARRAEGSKFRRGISMDRDGAGELWDPYAERYYVRMDMDYNGRVEAPDWDSETPIVPEAVLVWSTGEDLDLDVENVKTW